MDDRIFADLGLLAWYKDDLDEFIDNVILENKYINSKPGHKMTFGTCFTEEDFNIN